MDSITVPIKDKESKLAKERREVNKELPNDNHVSYAETEDDQPTNIVRRMQWILGSPSKAVVTPFAYTMAKPAWDIMLRRTNTLFYTPKDLELQLPPLEEKTLGPTVYRMMPPPVERDKPGSGALYSLLEKLKDVKDIKITLVGHSMGAIVVNKIVLLKPELPYKNIVHMASADSINNLFNTVVPYVNYKKTDVNFYSLMLHPDNEDREEAWGSLVPSGSLLTWIDNMYTSPETVLDKRSGRWDNIKTAIQYLPKDVKRNMHFKIFGLGINKDKGETCEEDSILGELGLGNGEYKECNKPQKHGDFDRMPFWDKTTWK
jgi:hypothetical protein